MICPACGWSIGISPKVKLLKELDKVFGRRISEDHIQDYVRTIGWGKWFKIYG